jgi:hypothetical protein
MNVSNIINKNKKIATGLFSILAIIVFYMFYWMYYLTTVSENFQLSDQSTQNFIKLQHTINPNAIFDIKMLKNQVNQQELDYFNNNGIWPWSPDVIELYKKSVEKNPYIRTYSEDAVLNTRKIYNQAAILKILSYQTKEGEMLLTGVKVPNAQPNPYEDLPNGFGDFGYNSGLIENHSDDVIKCNSNSNYSELERIKYMGKGGIFGEQNKKITNVDYNDLEEIIPGFTFVKGACNPCGPLNAKSDYSCPFELRLKEDDIISSVWKKLWNL